MNNANVQRIAQQFGGGAGHFVEDLHRIADRVGVPVGQITERLGRMFALSPDAVMANLDGLLEVLGVISAPGVTASIWMPGALGEWQGGLQSGNYTLSDGSTGYSAVDGTVGLVLDAAGSVGAELVTNGDFSQGATGWTVPAGWSVGSGVATASATSSSLLCGQFTPSPLKTYLVEFDWTHGGGTLYVAVGLGTAYSTTTSGHKRVVLTCGATPARAMEFYGGTVSGSIDGVSVREITGIHATQATTANKPALRRGLLNLLTYSNDLSNAAWPKLNVSIAAGQLDHLGGTTAFSVAKTSTPAADHRFQNSHTPSVLGPYTYATVLKANGVSSVDIYQNTDGSATYFTLDLSTGAISNNSMSVTPTVAQLGNAYWLVAYTKTANALTSKIASYISMGTAAGDGVAGILFSGGGVFPGTLTAAQILAEGGIPLTTATAASNSGAGRYSHQFDGSNDSLALGSVPFQMSDDHCVIAGLALGANATTRYATNPSAGAGSQRVGSIYINASNTIGAGWTDDVTAANITSPSTYTGQTVVASAVKQTNAKRLRVNGAQAGATDNTVMGTTTLTAGGAIGDWKSGGGNQWSGSIGPVILIKGTVSDADLLTLERWVASLTPAAPTF